MTHTFSCPVTIDDREVITLAHGSGGKDTGKLIEQMFLPSFDNAHLNMLHDGTLLNIPSHKIVFTTDSYVIQPIFFPGGDIGKLAVTGTVNDLAMCGAKPLYLSCGFIIEEGFLQADLKRIVESMAQEARAQSVQIVTGDTKVIERHGGNNIFINTSGIGVSMVENPINPLQIQSGDAILVSGDIGRHGMAVMAQREGFSFTSQLMSDCASLVPIVHAMIQEGIEIHCLRDATRGGVATSLIELSEKSEREFVLEEDRIPISQGVMSACELLGFDPLYVANEGRFVAFVPHSQAGAALKIMERFPEGQHAMNIGQVTTSKFSGVKMRNSFGIERPMYKLSGLQLPRIC